MSETSLAIETRNLTRRFGKLIAVSDLNLSVTKGAVYGLIGPNGAGKTTTLRMLAGLLDPTGGEILVNGLQVGNGDGGIQRQIGYMPDFFGVYDDLLVWEYLDFFARCYNLPSNRRPVVVSELLELVDLSEKRDAFVNTLSRGMRQRLCLAHALVHDPQVLLLDEPASGLDPRARVEMRELLLELSRMGKTIVVSSHILAELAEMCTDVGIIEKGKLAASGSVQEITRLAQHGRRISARILGDSAAASELVAAMPGVMAVASLPDGLEIDIDGGDEAAADLLEAMLAAGLRVASYQERMGDLEEIFLRLTQGESV